MHYAKEARPQVYMLYDFIYLTFWKSQNCTYQKQMSNCQGRGEELTIKEHKGILESDGTVLDFDLLKVIKLHFKRAEFIGYELHLNKPDF